jgi:protein TonB
MYNKFGNLDSTGVYQNGKKNGRFFKLGSVTKDSIVFLTQYEYEKDSLIRITNLKAELNNGKNADTLVEVTEGEYPGGKSQWMSYLVHNLRYPDRAIGKTIQGTVMVCFQVDEDSLAKDPFIFKSVEYSLDQESIRLILNAGKWLPRQKDGIPITALKIKPVSYRLEFK